MRLRVILAALASGVAAAVMWAIGWATVLGWAVATVAADGPFGDGEPYLDEDEQDEEFFLFQLAHGIAACPPECTDPRHAEVRSGHQ